LYSTLSTGSSTEGMLFVTTPSEFVFIHFSTIEVDLLRYVGVHLHHRVSNCCKRYRTSIPETDYLKAVEIYITMPVPKRRNKGGAGALAIPSISQLMLKLLDIDFIWQRTKSYVLYAFPCIVIYHGLQMEPKPNFVDLFNIWE
jgi:hypothetical protein